ncbi:MAG TPA: A/G-specific adenine glycosylase [Candidatus Nitrosotalea sp.]|nr:A/G-specific adenine glycosylase [Candidatus Nitrosotalea sp.]
MRRSGQAPAARRILQWYRRHGRSELPWRATRDPYRTVVSEFMLAQTQVDRVVPKFVAFVERFPDFASLASASTADVLREWKGLGYNSRAVRLHRLAREVVERYGGALPAEREALRAIPGIGPYTAAAIRAFAFDLDDAPIDTNVRRIVHRLCFGLEHPAPVAARQLDERARALVPPGDAHDWNSALMDLGSAICTARAPKCLLCPLRKECVAAPIDAAALERARAAAPRRRAPQERVPFEQSTRFARGRIVDRLRELPPGERISLLDLHRAIAPVVEGRSLEEVRDFVAALERDGLVTRDGSRVALRE